MEVAHEAGIGFVITTHDPQASALADEIYDINDGVLTPGRARTRSLQGRAPAAARLAEELGVGAALAVVADGAPDSRLPRDEWLWGWDPTPGIVSIWAETRRTCAALATRAGHSAAAPRRKALSSLAAAAELWTTCEHLGARLVPEDVQSRRSQRRSNRLTYRRLQGPGHLSLPGQRRQQPAAGVSASRRYVQAPGSPRLPGSVSSATTAFCNLPLEDQYLVATGQTYFRDLAFDDLHRLQFDLETTGLDPSQHRIFLVCRPRQPRVWRRAALDTNDSGSPGGSGGRERPHSPVGDPDSRDRSRCPREPQSAGIRSTFSGQAGRDCWA